jgi:hypothetical protein
MGASCGVDIAAGRPRLPVVLLSDSATVATVRRTVVRLCLMPFSPRCAATLGGTVPGMLYPYTAVPVHLSLYPGTRVPAVQYRASINNKHQIIKIYYIQ